MAFPDFVKALFMQLMILRVNISSTTFELLFENGSSIFHFIE